MTFIIEKSTEYQKIEIKKIDEYSVDCQKDQINRSAEIQSCIMPGFEVNPSFLKDGFLLFEPKSNLSGDFYWAVEHEGQLIIVLGDSTGHGVPGAMLSMIAFTVLYGLDFESIGFMPSKIIQKIHLALHSAFKKSRHSLSSRDGFDLAVVILNKNTNEIRFSGAKRPLIMVRSGELVEFKGDRNSTGLETPIDHEFKEMHYQYKSGDRFYLFTDGFQDQFGGKNDKRFTYRRFKKELQNNYTKSMEDQHLLFKTILKAWRASFPNTDDVSLIGLHL